MSQRDFHSLLINGFHETRALMYIHCGRQDPSGQLLELMGLFISFFFVLSFFRVFVILFWVRNL